MDLSLYFRNIYILQPPLKSNNKMEPPYSTHTKNESGNSLLSKLFQDKLDRQKLSVLEIADLIGERKEMLKRNVARLEYQLCDMGGIKHTLEGIRYFPDLEAHLKTKLGMEKSINELDLKKAEEYKQCWHDICELRKELLAGFLEYKSIQKKNRRSLSPSPRTCSPRTSPPILGIGIDVRDPNAFAQGRIQGARAVQAAAPTPAGLRPCWSGKWRGPRPG